MSNATYWYLHPCEQPSMKIRTETKTIVTRKFLFKKEHTEKINFWETNKVRWVCPVCKTTWDWSPGWNPRSEGFWMAKERKGEWRKYSL